MTWPRANLYDALKMPARTRSGRSAGADLQRYGVLSLGRTCESDSQGRTVHFAVADAAPVAVPVVALAGQAACG